MTDPTEGPWQYQEESDTYTHIVRGPNNRFICQLPQDTTGKSEAIARLIAAAGTAAQAAKDLGFDPIAAVEALPELLEVLENGITRMGCTFPGYNDAIAALDKARTRKG